MGIKMEQNQQSTAEQYSEQIEQLMELGRTQGYLTYAEINDLLPEDVIDPEYYDKLLQTLQHDAGIPVLDEAPESDEMMLNDTIPDEDAVEEATQILSNVESEIGRTTDPVRMYMREMGTVDLLTREDEISIAKRIEEGIDEVQTAIAAYPEALTELLDNYDQVEAGNYRLADLITGFVDQILPQRKQQILMRILLTKRKVLKSLQKLMMRAMRKMKAIAAQVLMTAILIIASILK